MKNLLLFLLLAGCTQETLNNVEQFRRATTDAYCETDPKCSYVVEKVEAWNAPFDTGFCLE